MMISRHEIKVRAKAQLGGGIFKNEWLMGLLVCVIFSLAMGISGVSVIGGIVILGPASYGLAKCFLNQGRTGKMDIKDILGGFTDDFGGIFILGFLSNLFIFLWSLLFVIPGIVKFYSYSMIYYIKIDNPDYDWRQCIDESRRMMKGHKAQLFIQDLSFIGWFIVGALFLGVGTLWVTPYMSASHSQFYEALKASCE